MAWSIDIMPEDGLPEFEFQGKTGLYKSGPGSLPFYKWVGSSRVEDVSDIPTAAQQTNSVPIPDVFLIGDAGIVSERFRELIENHEPDIHQFFRIDLSFNDGSEVEERHYIWHVTQYAPCVLYKDSKQKRLRYVKFGEEAGRPIYNCFAGGMVVSKPAFGNRKVFSTSIVNPGKLVVSDSIGTELRKVNISDLWMEPVAEVDCEWRLEEDVPELMSWLKEHPEKKEILNSL